MRELKAGWHRVTCRDGTIIGMLVDDSGRIGEFMQLAKRDPPKRVSRRFVGTVEEVRARAERRRMEQEIRMQEEVAEIMARVRSRRG